MTFIEYLKIKKDIDPAEGDLDELMTEYYDEYAEYLQQVKDGCGEE
jgi:hypothetical protein